MNTTCASFQHGLRPVYFVLIPVLFFQLAVPAFPRDFSKKPEVPFEATTTAQDALIEVAEKTRMNNVEAEPLAACDALIADETLPPPLREWAARRKVELLTYTMREGESVEAGRKWLAEHPDGEGALEMRLAVAHIMATRENARFVPEYQEVRKFYDDFFSRHDPLDLRVMECRLEYAMLLFRLSQFDPAARVEALSQCDTAAKDAGRLATSDPVLALHAAGLALRATARKVQLTSARLPSNTREAHIESLKRSEGKRKEQEARLNEAIRDGRWPTTTPEYWDEETWERYKKVYMEVYEATQAEIDTWEKPAHLRK